MSTIQHLLEVLNARPSFNIRHAVAWTARVLAGRLIQVLQIHMHSLCHLSALIGGRLSSRPVLAACTAAAAAGVLNHRLGVWTLNSMLDNVSVPIYFRQPSIEYTNALWQATC